MSRTMLTLLSAGLMALGVAASAALLPTETGTEALDLALEGGARIVADDEIGTEVLALGGEAGTYAHCATPEDWGRLANFRVDLKVRIDQYRAGTVPFGWPGSFLIYFNGEGKPWVLLETDSGRLVMAGEEPVAPGRWLEIAFEYRAQDVGLLYVNGRSVASIHGRGPLKLGGPDVWLGRYMYKDDETGEEDNSWVRGAVAQPRLTLLADDDRLEFDASGMSNAMNVSWGDSIVVGKGWRALNKLEHAVALVEECKRLGVKKMFLRCSHEVFLTFYESRMGEDHWYTKAANAVEGDVVGEIIKQCHAAGIKVYAYSTIFDQGSPTSVLYGGSAPFPWQSRFTIEHPEYVTESRDGKKRQWGVACYAYPEAREYVISIFEHMLKKWAFDGIYICTRTHSQPAEFADQFGYNQPIVDEFKRRHGVDIRTEPFSKPQWWDLQGEYLTQLMRDFRKALGDMEIVIAMPRSDYIGPPYGNMRLDWRTWCQEGLIDGIVLGVTSGGWHYPDTRNRPGYIQSQQDNVGMREVDFDLGKWFGPACKEHGIELYLQRSGIFSDADQELLDHPGMTGFMVHLGY